MKNNQPITDKQEHIGIIQMQKADDEVPTLASRTQSSTEEITRLQTMVKQFGIGV